MDEKKLEGFAKTLFKNLAARVPFAVSAAQSSSSSSSTFGFPLSGAPGGDSTAAVSRRSCARSSRFNPYWRDAASRKASRSRGGSQKSLPAAGSADAPRRAAEDAAWPLAPLTTDAELRAGHDGGAPASPASSLPSATRCLSSDAAAVGGGVSFTGAVAVAGVPTAIASTPHSGKDRAGREPHVDVQTAGTGNAVGGAAELGVVASELFLAETAAEPVSAATMVPVRTSDLAPSSEDGGGLPARGGSFRRAIGNSAIAEFFRNSVRFVRNDIARSSRGPLRDVQNVQRNDAPRSGGSLPSSVHRHRKPAAAAGRCLEEQCQHPASHDASKCNDFATRKSSQDYFQDENPEAQTTAKPAQILNSAIGDTQNASCKIDRDRDLPRDAPSCCRHSISLSASPVSSVVPVEALQPLTAHHSSNCFAQNAENVLSLTGTDESPLLESYRDGEHSIATVNIPATAASASNGLLMDAECNIPVLSCMSTAEWRPSDETALLPTATQPDAPSSTPVTPCNNRVFDVMIADFVKAERTYVRNLCDVIDGYKTRCEQHGDLFSKGDVMLLFGNISDIYQFTCELLSSMEQCVTLSRQRSSSYGGQDDTASCSDAAQAMRVSDGCSQNDARLANSQSCTSLCCNFAQCFLDMVQGFLVYSDYCTNQDRALQLYASLACEARYRSFFEGCRLLQGMERIPLNGFLLAPVQKICKYHLQLADLVRHSACARSTSSDGNSAKGCCQSLTSALSRMRDVVQQINESKRLAESRRAIEEWQVKVAHWQGDDVSRGNSRLLRSGELVLEEWLASERSGVLKRVARRGRHYFLFDRELVECRKTSSLHGGRQLSLCRRYRLSHASPRRVDAVTAPVAPAASPDCPTEDELWELIDAERASADDAIARSGSTVRLGSVPSKLPHSLLLRPTRRLVNDAKDGGLLLLCMRSATEKAEWLQAVAERLSCA